MLRQAGILFPLTILLTTLMVQVEIDLHLIHDYTMILQNYIYTYISLPPSSSLASQSRQVQQIENTFVSLEVNLITNGHGIRINDHPTTVPLSTACLQVAHRQPPRR